VTSAEELFITGEERVITAEELFITGEERVITAEELFITGEERVITADERRYSPAGPSRIGDARSRAPVTASEWRMISI
jgi:hypothetical protein